MVLSEVEKVEFTSIVDNTVDILLPSSEIAVRPRLSLGWHAKPQLIAEHGFSTLVVVEVGGKTRTILFDTGLDPMTAVHNAEALGIDLSACEGLVLSHGHNDHAAGLLNMKRKLGSRKLPLMLHSHAFRKRMVVLNDGSTWDLPPPERTTVEAAGYQIVEKNDSSFLLDGAALLSGQIERTTDFEKGLPVHYAEVEGKLEKDPLILDDQALIMNLKGKGLIVLTGCGHAGLINTIHHAQAVTGISEVFAVMGGMHLTGGLFEPIIPRTISELKSINPSVAIPCHCTGWKAVHEVARHLPDAFIQNSVGTKYVFSA